MASSAYAAVFVNIAIEGCICGQNKSTFFAQLSPWRHYPANISESLPAEEIAKCIRAWFGIVSYHCIAENTSSAPCISSDNMLASESAILLAESAENHPCCTAFYNNSLGAFTSGKSSVFNLSSGTSPKHRSMSCNCPGMRRSARCCNIPGAECLHATPNALSFSFQRHTLHVSGHRPAARLHGQHVVQPVYRRQQH